MWGCIGMYVCRCIGMGMCVGGLGGNGSAWGLIIMSNVKGAVVYHEFFWHKFYKLLLLMRLDISVTSRILWYGPFVYVRMSLLPTTRIKVIRRLFDTQNDAMCGFESFAGKNMDSEILIVLQQESFRCRLTHYAHLIQCNRLLNCLFYNWPFTKLAQNFANYQMHTFKTAKVF